MSITKSKSPCPFCGGHNWYSYQWRFPIFLGMLPLVQMQDLELIANETLCEALIDIGQDAALGKLAPEECTKCGAVIS